MQYGLVVKERVIWPFLSKQCIKSISPLSLLSHTPALSHTLFLSNTLSLSLTLAKRVIYANVIFFLAGSFIAGGLVRDNIKSEKIVTSR